MGKSKQHNIKSRRRLSELYVKGVEVHFNETGWGRYDRKGVQITCSEGYEPPPEGAEDDEVLVWVQPPSPLQREQSLREAQAARSRAVLAAKNEDGSVDALNTKAFVASMKLDTLIDYVLQVGESERREEAERDVRGREEWEDFTALQDSMRQWDEAGHPRTEEWQPLIERDAEFGRQVSEAAKHLRESARESLSMMNRSKLEERAFDKRIELVGSQAFMQEYERQMLFCACRDPDDHQELFFDDPDDLQSHEEVVQEALGAALAVFIDEASEAKNSQRAADGSKPSEQPDEPETSESSTPEDASA